MASEASEKDEAAQLQRISQFTLDHFKLCKCNRYVRIDVENDEGAKSGLFEPDDCACGRPFRWHSARQLISPSPSTGKDVRYWSTSEDTTSYQCNTFGKLMFAAGEGFNSSAILPEASAFYIRLASENDTDYMESIYQLMTLKTLWSLPLPHTIIEVAGTQQKLQDIDPLILDRFTKGLIKAANTAKAWIVTNGMNTGITELVGNSVSKSRITQSGRDITCLGITNWSFLNNREQLVISEHINNPEALPYAKIGDINEKATDRILKSPSTSGTVSLELNDVEAPGKGNATNNFFVQGKSTDILSKLTRLYYVERLHWENWEYGISLNPGHNAFLLIDNGREKRFGEEIEFRAHFLHYLSQKMLYENRDRGISTPPILLLAGGGIEALKTLELTVAGVGDGDGDDKAPKATNESVFEGRQNENINENLSPRPAIILLNFGGVSNLIAFAYAITAPPVDKDCKFYQKSSRQRDDVSRFPIDFDDRIRRHPAFDEVLELSEQKDDENSVIGRIRNCLRFRHMLTVIDLSDKNECIPLDEAILNAVLKSSLTAPETSFSLALLWDRVDIANQLLMRHEKEIRRTVDMKAALAKSIIKGQSEVFQLLIESGMVDLHAYLTRDQIRFLYSEIFLKRHGKAGKATCIWLFRSFLVTRITEEKLADETNPYLLHQIGNILAYLLGCYLDNVFTDEKSYNGATLSSLAVSIASVSTSPLDVCPYETSIRDLFILQLLLHRRDLAVYVWKLGHDLLGTALMGSIFLKSLAREANRLDMTDLGNAYKESAREWRERAITLLASCYEQDSTTCSRILTRSLITWQGATTLEIAFYGDVKKFMEQPAIQTTLMQIWMGHLSNFTKQYLVYLALLPPLLPFLIVRLRFEKEKAVHLNTTLSAKLPRWASLFITGEFSGRRANSRVGSVNSGALEKPPQTKLAAFSASSKKEDLKLARASIFGCNRGGRISVFTAIYMLYASPIAKCAVHSASIVGFLLLFSCFLLDGSQERGVTMLEVTVWGCCVVFFLDLLRDAFGKTNLSVVERIKDFLSNAFAIAELITLLLVALAALVKLFWWAPEAYIYSHTIYSVACVIYWLKSLRIFFVTATVGPKVITLFKMLRDLAFFTLIYMILLLSFSVPIHTLMYPHDHFTDGKSYIGMLSRISYERMWNIFFIALDDARNIVEGTCGEDDGEVATNSSSDNSTATFSQNEDSQLLLFQIDPHTNETFLEPINPTSCSTRNILAIALYIIYLLLTYIMLLNMLVAMFAHTVDKTRLSATRLWRFDMYRFLYEYYTRPILPGPLMIFELVYRFVVFVYRWGCGSPIPENTDLKHFYTNIDDFNYRMMEMFERSALESAHSETSRDNNHDTNAKILRIAMERINTRLDCIEANLATPAGTGDHNMSMRSVSEPDMEDC